MLQGFDLNLPFWVQEFLDKCQDSYPTAKDKMRVAVELSRLNVLYKTGGPFGAAIFNRDNHQLVSVGVNIVVEEMCSMAHAEVIAIALAQKSCGCYDLGGDREVSYVLASSAQPCVMCFGSILWSGVKELICGALVEDVEKIVGFDEGPLPENWKQELLKREITVTTGILKEEALKVLELYVQEGGIVYNSRR